MAIAGLPLAAAISGGTSLLGGLLGQATSAGSVQQQEQFQASQVQQQEQFQENMSNTAYQRATQGMEAAGINPILAAGQPASTPSGSSASGGSFVGQNILGQAGSSAMNALSTTSQVEQQQAQTDATKANTANTQANTAKTLASLPYVSSSAKAAASSAASNASMDAAEAGPSKTWFGQKVMPWLHEFGIGGTNIGHSASAAYASNAAGGTVADTAAVAAGAL